MGKSVLIAEDSPVVCDLVQLFLTKSGHEATICEDGRKALDALLARDFDVALIDYYLPNLNGDEVVSLFTKAAGGRPLPRFLAMTADPQKFLQSNQGVEKFETVLQKPLDIEALIKRIESEPATRSVANISAEGGRERRFANIGLNLLYYPDDFTADVAQRTHIRLDLQDAPDALVVTALDDPGKLWSLAAEHHLHTTPLIDLSGRLGRCANLSGRADVITDNDVRTLVERFHKRDDRVHPDLRKSDEPRHQLLTRCYMNNGEVAVSLDAGTSRLAQYQALMDASVVEREAVRLVEDGLLTRRFQHRLHVCPTCSGSRFNVSEVCHKCRSGALSEEAYVHHYRCAYQDVRSAFQKGDDLVCPKCGWELSQFSKDYDLPGMAVLCQSCRTSATEPDIDFLCLDCFNACTGEKVETRDVFSYAITERGRAAVELGQQADKNLAGVFRFSDLPLQLVAHLNRQVSQSGSDVHLILAAVSYPKLRDKEIEHGAGAVVRTRAFLLSQLKERLAPDETVAAPYVDYLLFTDPAKAGIANQLPTRVQQVAAELTFDLEPHVDAFTEKDIF